MYIFEVCDVFDRVKYLKLLVFGGIWRYCGYFRRWNFFGGNEFRERGDLNFYCLYLFFVKFLFFIILRYEMRYFSYIFDNMKVFVVKYC